MSCHVFLVPIEFVIDFIHLNGKEGKRAHVNIMFDVLQDDSVVHLLNCAIVYLNDIREDR